MNNNMIKLNDKTYIVTDDRGEVRVLQGTHEEEIIDILNLENEIEEAEEEISYHEDILSFIQRKGKVSKYMTYYRILAPAAIITLNLLTASSLVPLELKQPLFDVLVDYIYLTILGEVISRGYTFVLPPQPTFGKILESNPKMLFTLGTKKSRGKEEQKQKYILKDLRSKVIENRANIALLKDSSQCKEVPYTNDEKITIAPIERSLEETNIKVSTLGKARKKTK